MKILVLAQAPPPLHGQSAMVGMLLAEQAGLGVELKHVNLGLSRDAADVGRFRLGKIGAVSAACLRAVRLRLREGPMLLYYIPAPGRRVPLYRDWIAMALCRPWFGGLILHWHATGLSDWLNRDATAPERAITRALLGRPALSIALSEELGSDAQFFGSRRIALVANGIPDPAGQPVNRSTGKPVNVLFIGLGSEEKGLLDTAGAIAELDALEPGAFRLTFAGSFQNADVERRFRHLLKPGVIEYAGFADGDRKRRLLQSGDVFCLPTYYPHEGQPLALIEALAYDLPIVTTRWRGIPGMLPRDGIVYVDPKSPRQIAEALRTLRAQPPPNGARRAHFLQNFTREKWVEGMRGAIVTADILGSSG